MVIKGQDPLKIKKKPASYLTTNHVISWLYLVCGRVDISAIRNHLVTFQGTINKPFCNLITETNMAKETFDKSGFQGH